MPTGIFRFFLRSWGQMLLISQIFIWSAKSPDCRSPWSGTLQTLFRALIYMAIVKKFLSVSINYLPWDGSLTSSGRPIMGKLTKNFCKMSNPVGKPDTPPPPPPPPPPPGANHWLVHNPHENIQNNGYSGQWMHVSTAVTRFWQKLTFGLFLP
jgi:hypothetical protein